MTDAIILDANKETSIVFGGIAWKPLIGANLAAQSEKWAITNKATHFVAAGEHSAAVGTTKLPAERAKEKGRSFYSAAAIFAQAHQNGVIITTQPMSDVQVWVVAAQDGVIIRDTDVLLSNEESLALVTEIKNRYPSARTIKGEFETLQYLNSKSKLTPVRSGLQKIPTPIKIGAGILIVLMVLDTSWGQYKKYRDKQARDRESQQFIDVHAEWTNALNQWASTVEVDGPNGLTNVYNALGLAPMKIEGWNLSEASCTPAPRAWDCIARYDAGINATNVGFKAGLPDGWTAKWGGLTTALGIWTVPVERKTINRARIQEISNFSLVYISGLQRVLPAFRKVELAPPAVVEVPTPQAYVNRGKGMELVQVPYPNENTEGIELPSFQKFEIEGPLRSIAVLPTINETVIKELRVVVGGQGSVPTLRDSIFTAKLIGEFYVR